MIRLFFLLPVVMCALWWFYLNQKGYSAKDGIKGFVYILALNAVIIGFFLMMIVVTK